MSALTGTKSVRREHAPRTRAQAQGSIISHLHGPPVSITNHFLRAIVTRRGQSTGKSCGSLMVGHRIPREAADAPAKQTMAQWLVSDEQETSSTLPLRVYTEVHDDINQRPERLTRTNTYTQRRSCALCTSRATAASARAAADSPACKLDPFSEACPRRVSKGIRPRKGTPNRAAMPSAPRTAPPMSMSEAGKMSDVQLQCGHTKPAMFSMMPRTLTPALRQKLISFRTSSNAISCRGVGCRTDRACATCEIDQHQIARTEVACPSAGG